MRKFQNANSLSGVASSRPISAVSIVYTTIIDISEASSGSRPILGASILQKSAPIHSPSTCVHLSSVACLQLELSREKPPPPAKMSLRAAARLGAFLEYYPPDRPENKMAGGSEILVGQTIYWSSHECWNVENVVFNRPTVSATSVVVFRANLVLAV
eukprot:3309423-Pyramimonas_sp.AAC.1